MGESCKCFRIRKRGRERMYVVWSYQMPNSRSMGFDSLTRVARKAVVILFPFSYRGLHVLEDTCSLLHG